MWSKGSWASTWILQRPPMWWINGLWRRSEKWVRRARWRSGRLYFSVREWTEIRGMSGFRLRLNAACEVEKVRNGCRTVASPSGIDTGGRGGITPRVNWEFYESLLLIYPEIAHGVNLGHFQKLPPTLISICSLGNLRNCSEKTFQFAWQVIDWKNPWFLSQICSKYAHKIPEPLIQSSFINYSECVQPHTHWVCFNLLKDKSQFGSVFQQTLKELIEWMV